MHLRPFQIGLIATFAIMAVVALFLLSRYQTTKTATEVAYGNEVVVWGTQDAAIMDRLFQNIAQEDKAFAVVRYHRVDERNFDNEFLNAIAEGRTPDLVVLSSDSLVKHRAKLLAIPYETFSTRDFRDTYVDGAEIFALRDGIYALPFGVDPLLMYWNRDIFASNGLAQAPTTWADVVGNVVPRTTLLDQRRTPIQSGIAFGEYRNVFRAKDILLLLALQSGSGSVYENERGYVVGLNEPVGEGAAKTPFEAGLQFFTDFSNVNSSNYSWNRALPEDTQAFLAGDLALYFGRGSEAESLSRKNPNLNFDIAPVPQGGAPTARRGYGTFYGLAIPKAATRNLSGAYNAALKITSAKYANELTAALNIAPVRRDLVAAGANDPYRSVMLQSALVARGWLDPDPVASDRILMQMVEDVVSNRSRVGMAVNDAVSRLVLEF